MYPRALGDVALDPALTCQGLPYSDPCWLADTPTVITTPGGGTGGGGLPAPPWLPLDNSGYTVPPTQQAPILLGVTGTPTASAGLPWYVWAGMLVGGVWALSKRRGGGGSWQ